MSVGFGVEYFNATHGTNAFLVSTLLTIVGARLMDDRLANAAFLEFGRVRIVARLFRRERFVFVDRTTSTFGRVTRAFFPRIRRNHLAQFLLTFFANHFRFFFLIFCIFYSQLISKLIKKNLCFLFLFGFCLVFV